MYKNNIAASVKIVTRDHVPATVPVVTFATLAGIRRQFGFQADTSTRISLLVDEAGVVLIVDVLVG